MRIRFRGIKNSGYNPVVTQLRTFATARQVLNNFITGTGPVHKSQKFGCAERIRDKEKRLVHTLETDDGSGVKLVIEVYTKGELTTAPETMQGPDPNMELNDQTAGLDL